MGRKELLALMVGASTINYLGRTTMAIAGPDIARQFAFDEQQLGQIFSAFWLGYGLMMWPSGWMADRWGPGRVLGICGLLTAVLLGANAFVAALAGFLLLRLLFGVASAVLYPACGSLTLSGFPHNRVALVQGLVIGGGGLGSAVAPLLVVWVSGRWGWPSSFLAVGGLTLAFFTYWKLRIPRDGIRPADETPSNPLRLSRPLLLLAAQGFCIGYFYSFGDTWSFYYFREVRHFPEEQSALFAMLLQVLGGVMMPLGGWVSDLMAPRFGRIGPALAGLAGGAFALAISVRTESPAAVIAAIAISYGLIVACEGAFSWALLHYSPEAPATGFGFANSVGSGAQFLAPLIFPWVAARWGWNASVLTAAAALGAGAVLWGALPRSSSSGSGR